MLRTLLSFTALVAALLSSTAHAAAISSTQDAVGSICWPLHFAGVTLDVTTDAQLRRLLGAGVFRQTEGDTGGRYFVDQRHSATLHVVMYTDSVVGEMTLLAGVDASLNKREQEKARSKFFDPEEGFGKWHALHLGSSKTEVLANLGTPAIRNNDNVWEYSASCACEIPHHMMVYFSDGRLFKVVFSAPAG